MRYNTALSLLLPLSPLPTMTCPQCAAAVPTGSAFCPKCGSPVASDAAAAVSKPTPVEQVRQRAAAAGGDNDAERQLWQGGFSPKAMIGYWLLAGLVTIAAIVASVLFPDPMVWMVAAAVAAALWLAFAGYLLYERLSVEYTLTSQRLVHKTGILRRVANRIEMIDIDDVTYEQGIIERMVGVGSIKILSSDTSHPKLTMRGIDEVQRVANIIDDTRRDERRKRGMYIETV